MTLNATRSTVPHIYFTSVHESQFEVSFAQRPAVGVTGNFDTSAPNPPKMTLNTKR